MARTGGIAKFKGSLDDLVFYELDGQRVVRRKGRVSKSVFKKSKRYARVRENCSEFGHASRIAKLIRSSVLPGMRQLTDKTAGPYLVSAIVKTLKKGEGTRGMLGFDLQSHPENLIGFSFRKGHTFGELLPVKLPEPVFLNGRLTCQVQVPALNTQTDLNAPTGSTHLRFYMQTLTLSQYADIDGEYLPTNKAANGLRSLAEGDLISLSAANLSAQTLSCTLNASTPLAEDVAVVVILGLAFYQEVNGEHKLLEQGRGCVVLGVG